MILDTGFMKKCKNAPMQSFSKKKFFVLRKNDLTALLLKNVSTALKHLKLDHFAAKIES
jgi:hypothetical protein